MYVLIVVIVINGVQTRVFEEFPVFDSKAECTAVIDGWLNVPVNRGRVAIVTCQKV